MQTYDNYHKQYTKKNRKKITEKTREYRQKYYEENKERILAKAKLRRVKAKFRPL